MTRGEIYLAKFPFGGSPGMKLRPVLLLTGAVGPVPEVLAAYISSVLPSQALPSDVMVDPALPEHASTHLKTASVIRLHKLATLHEQTLIRILGQLSPATLMEVSAKLRALLSL